MSTCRDFLVVLISTMATTTTTIMFMFNGSCVGLSCTGTGSPFFRILVWILWVVVVIVIVAVPVIVATVVAALTFLTHL